MMKLMMQPGSALLVLAGLAFVLRLFATSIPLIGGLLGFILWFAIVFGVLGGLFLLYTGRREPAFLDHSGMTIEAMSGSAGG